MRILAPILALVLLGACQSFSWTGEPGDPDSGLANVGAMAGQYETESYWRNHRRSIDGLTNALSRDLGGITATFARHFMNYSATDPYVNYETENGYLREVGKWAVSFTNTVIPIRF